MAQTSVAVAPLAFEDFFEAERGGLFGAVYLLTGNVEESEEIVQDAFLAMWERWDRVRSLERPTGYLYRTAHPRRGRGIGVLPWVLTGSGTRPEPRMTTWGLRP